MSDLEQERLGFLWRLLNGFLAVAYTIVGLVGAVGACYFINDHIKTYRVRLLVWATYYQLSIARKARCRPLQTRPKILANLNNILYQSLAFHGLGKPGTS